MKIRERDRVLEIAKKMSLDTSYLKINEKNLNDFGLSISKELKKSFVSLYECPELKWCFSTIKKAKVFIVVYQANENSKPMYKEEVAKQLPEYSYKTISTIVDEGVSKGYFITLDPVQDANKDKKIKNIRPSVETLIAFYKWNMERLDLAADVIKNFKK